MPPTLAAVAWLAIALGCAAACDKARGDALPTSPSPLPSTSSAPTPTGSANVCAPSESAPGGRISDPSGPYFHRVAVGQISDDGRLTDTRHVLEHASVPDGVRAPDGRLLIYYVNGEDGGVWVARLEGSTATPLSAIAINGVPRPSGVVDPDAYVVNGRIRLAYLAGFGGPSDFSNRAMCLAESDDGVNFTALGPAISASGETWTDPSVAQLPDGRWLMAISAGRETILARSSDGLSFTAGQRVSFGGVPEVAVPADGRVRLYVCAQGIERYVSPDGGDTWTLEATLLQGTGLACDPSHVAGTDLFIYKTGY